MFMIPLDPPPSHPHANNDHRIDRLATTFDKASANPAPQAGGPKAQGGTGEIANDGLTHFDAAGQAHMVDVGGKADTHRIAVATGTIHMKPATLALIQSGTVKKGDVLGVARIAAIMATKRTSELIPLCHPLALTRVTVEFEIDSADGSITCRAEVETYGKTGVEIEALFAVQIGLLTIYDMCKAVDRGMVMQTIRLTKKDGGSSGTWITL